MLRNNSLSRLGVKIEVRREFAGDVVLACHASGFLWRADDRLFLVSNLHNLSGWDEQRQTSLSPTGATPNQLMAHIRYEQPTEGPLGITANVCSTFDLVDSEGRPNWWVHPRGTRDFDVAVLLLPEIAQTNAMLDGVAQRMSLFTQPVNEADFVNFEPAAGDDAYVLGYPKGLDGGLKLPIWKRASVATEPFVDVDGLPVVLIDTATRQGMSGAPVICVRRGLTYPRGMTDLGAAVIGESVTFLGVYSGRVGDDELGLQLGRVWKASIIDEIIAGRTRDEPRW